MKFLLFVVGVVADIFRGFVLSKFWAWFLVPLGVLNISLAHAVGIVFFASLFSNSRGDEKTDDETLFNVVGSSFFQSAFLLVAGWFTTIFL